LEAYPLEANIDDDVVLVEETIRWKDGELPVLKAQLESEFSFSDTSYTSKLFQGERIEAEKERENGSLWVRRTITPEQVKEACERVFVALTRTDEENVLERKKSDERRGIHDFVIHPTEIQIAEGDERKLLELACEESLLGEPAYENFDRVAENLIRLIGGRFEDIHYGNSNWVKEVSLPLALQNDKSLIIKRFPTHRPNFEIEIYDGENVPTIWKRGENHYELFSVYKEQDPEHFYMDGINYIIRPQDGGHSVTGVVTGDIIALSMFNFKDRSDGKGTFRQSLKLESVQGALKNIYMLYKDTQSPRVS